MQSLRQPANEPNRKARRLRSFGVAMLLAAPLLAGTTSAMAASPAANAPVASARNPAAPDTAVAHAAVHYPRAFIEWKLSVSRHASIYCGTASCGRDRAKIMVFAVL